MIFPSIKGTIYNIEHSTRGGKKDPSQSYDIYKITLEVKGDKKTEFPQLESFGEDLSMYTKRDFVEIEYELCGFRWKKDDGAEKIINRTAIKNIKYADLESSKKHIKHVDDSKVDYSKLMVAVDAPESTDTEDDGLPF
jgi:hypothetical protein